MIIMMPYSGKFSIGVDFRRLTYFCKKNEPRRKFIVSCKLAYVGTNKYPCKQVLLQSVCHVPQNQLAIIQYANEAKETL